MLAKELLETLTFGQRVAEEELPYLAQYFVETDQWKRILQDQIDIVYGPKGSGKSALYALLLTSKEALFDAGVFVVAAENPRDTPAFKEVLVDPPTTERECEYLWKLYFLCLVGQVLAEYSVSTTEARAVLSALQESGLLPRQYSLGSLLRAAVNYIRRRRIESVETGLQINPATGLPEGLIGKVTLREPTEEARLRGSASIDDLFRMADTALNELRYIVWISLDRLDVVFCEDQELEERALRALFRVYLDLRALKNIRLKVFLRTDIWSRLTRGGFREASHITRTVNISWDADLLLNLIVRRLLNNESIRRFYNVESDEVLRSSDSQLRFFYRVFPPTVQRSGSRSLSTIEWIITRTQDGLQHPSPREIIHLLNRARELQLQRLDIGGKEPEGGLLFHRGVLKDALPEVSKVRLDLTVYAEYPGLRAYIEALERESSLQTLENLAALWAMTPSEATRIALKLEWAGVLQPRGGRSRQEYQVPFLYHSALNLKSGGPGEELDGD